MRLSPSSRLSPLRSFGGPSASLWGGGPICPRVPTNQPRPTGRLARRPCETVPASGDLAPGPPCPAARGGRPAGGSSLRRAVLGPTRGPPLRRNNRYGAGSAHGLLWSARPSSALAGDGPPLVAARPLFRHGAGAPGLVSVFGPAQGPRLGRAAPRRLFVGPPLRGASPRRVTAPGGLSSAPRIEINCRGGPPRARPAGRAGGLAWARRPRLRSAARAPPVCGLPRGGSPLRVCAPASARLRSFLGPPSPLFCGAGPAPPPRGLARSRPAPQGGGPSPAFRASPPPRLFLGD